MRSKKNMPQGDVVDKDNNDVDVEKDKIYLDGENLNKSFTLDEQGYMKGIFGNLSVMKRDINSMKEEMYAIKRDFDQLSRTTSGERTLGQHLDRL